MKRIIYLIIALAISVHPQEFWEPAQISVQARDYSLFGYMSSETYDSRKIHSLAFGNFSIAAKVNQFDVTVGVSTNQMNNLSYSIGSTFFYYGDGDTPFIHYSHTYNWLMDKWDKRILPGDDHEIFMDSATRSVSIFEVGYNFVMPHAQIQCSMGFIQGIQSKATLVAPMPILQIGISVNLWKHRRTTPELIFR